MIHVNSEVQLTYETVPVRESPVVEGVSVKSITKDMTTGEGGISSNKRYQKLAIWTRLQ